MDGRESVFDNEQAATGAGQSYWALVKENPFYGGKPRSETPGFFVSAGAHPSMLKRPLESVLRLISLIVRLPLWVGCMDWA